jgi:hypothetical protein
LPGASKTTNIIKYAINNEKKILVVCPTNALALDIKQTYVEAGQIVSAIIFCTLVGLIVGKDIEEKQKQTFNVEGFDIILIDEIYNLSTSDLNKLKRFITNHNKIQFIASGDKYQNKPIEEIRNKTLYNEVIESLFLNHLQLKKSRRIQDPNQVATLLNIKNELFSQDSITNISDIIVKYKFNIVNGFNKDSLNIAYYNAICEKLADIKLVKGEHLYVKERFLVNKKVFQSNFTFKLLTQDLSQCKTLFPVEKVRLQDVFTKEIHEIPIKFIKNFRPTYVYTSHSIQRTTTNKNVIIHDTFSKHITPEWFWVAITRCTDLAKVSIYKRDTWGEKQINTNFFDNADVKTITFEEANLLFNKQNGICPICANSIIRPSVDRINNSIGHITSNCQITCLRCNVTKK